MLIQKMTEGECLDLLARSRLGHLGCAHQNQPYVVPIYFACERRCLYGFTTPGQKLEWMRYNPLVCVEVDEVGGGERWTSVIAFGRFEELPNLPDWKDPSLHALELLNRHAGWWEPGCAAAADRDPSRQLTPVFYRIRLDNFSGRRATPGPDTPGLQGRNRGGWLGRMLSAVARPFAGRLASLRNLIVKDL